MYTSPPSPCWRELGKKSAGRSPRFQQRAATAVNGIFARPADLRDRFDGALVILASRAHVVRSGCGIGSDHEKVRARRKILHGAAIEDQRPRWMVRNNAVIPKT